MYLTIANQRYTHESIIKKSRFIVNFARISSEFEAQTFIDTIRKEHYKANHNVFAYTLGDHDEIQRMSDDGEPSGTAGVPILEVIKRKHLHDIVVVVTRYFGGIKLGAGGLIRAYAGTPADALEKITFVQRIPQKQLILTFNYANLDKLQYWLQENHFSNPELEYTDQIKATLSVNDAELVSFKNDLINLLNGQIDIQDGPSILAEVPYIPDR